MVRRLSRRVEVWTGALLALPTPAFAADPELLPTLGQAAMRSLAALGVVLALILLLAWLFKRLRQSSPVISKQGPLQSIARLDLGGRREIRLVRVEDRELVIGVSGDRIELLTETTAPGGAGATDAPGDDDARTTRHPALEVLRKLASS